MRQIVAALGGGKFIPKPQLPNPICMFFEKPMHGRLRNSADGMLGLIADTTTNGDRPEPLRNIPIELLADHCKAKNRDEIYRRTLLILV